MPRLSLSVKLIILVIISTLLPVIIIELLFNSIIEKLFTSQQLAVRQEISKETQLSIQKLFKDIEDDSIFFRGFFEHSLKDSKPNFSPKEIKLFFSYLDTKPQYYQVRFLDLDGNEVFKFVRMKENAYLVEDDQLQNKSDRPFFQNSLALERDELYVSRIDLNEENGVVENIGTKDSPEYVPVVRISTPVYSENDQKVGFLVLNVFAKTIIDEIHDILFTGETIALANSEGTYLHHTDPSKEWGSQLNNPGSNLWKEFPNQADWIKNNPDTSLIVGDRVYTKVVFDPHKLLNSALSRTVKTNETEWYLVNEIKRGEFFAKYDEIRRNTFFFTLSLSLALVWISILFSRSVTSPLDNLTDYVRRIAEGDLGPPLDEEQFSSKELADLTKGINEMAVTIKSYRDETDRAVTAKTTQLEEKVAELESLNRLMVGRELKMEELKQQLKQLKAQQGINDSD